MREKLPECVRCGLCCVAAPCTPNKKGVCKYLSVNGDLTTTCLNKMVVENLIGIGCVMRSSKSSYTYEEQCEIYSLVDTKRALLVEKI